MITLISTYVGGIIIPSSDEIIIAKRITISNNENRP